MSTPPSPSQNPPSLKALTLNTYLPSLAEFTPTKDVRYHPLFRGLLFPWVWRVWTQRITRAGRYFGWATLLFALFGAAALDQQWYVPFTYAFGLWTVALLAMWQQSPRVRLHSAHADRVTAGETLPVEVDITALRRRAVGLTVLPDRLPPEVDAVPPDGAGLPPLKPDESARVHLGLRCRRRGVFRLRGYRVETAYPLGLMVAQRVFSEPRTLLVLPRFTPLARMDAPHGRRYQIGETAVAANLGESLEYIGNREYREGDSVRSIDWRATARLSRPVVREYREEYLLRAAVLLDTHLPLPPGLPSPPVFEQAVSITAAAAEFLARSEYRVDLLAAGATLHEVSSGKGTAAAEDILDLLATVGTEDEEAFESLEEGLNDHLSQLTLIVCILLDWDQVREEFVERLREQGVGVKVVIVRDRPCTLPPGEEMVLTSAQVDAGVEAL